MNPNLNTCPESFEEQNQRLRRRIHELQIKHDREKAELQREVMDLRIQLEVVKGVTRIGKRIFWDITKCAQQPLHLSISDAETIGARALLGMIQQDRDTIREI